MRTRRMYGWMVLGCLLVVAPTWALPMGTAFTYQGFLEKPAGTPVTDTCDLRFNLLDAPAGVIVGSSPQVATGVSVASGNFSVEIDFGASAFTGVGRWLTIEVKCTGDGAYVLMSPAVELTPAPYALALPGLRTPETATVPNVIGGGPENTMSAGVEGGTIAGGGIISPNSESNVVVGDGGTVGGGTGNGADMFATVAGGYNNGAAGQSSAIGGGEANFAGGARATVGGGIFNWAGGELSTVGGGNSNLAFGLNSTVGGGVGNSTNASLCTVAGGGDNEALAAHATVGGGLNNTASETAATVAGGHSNDAGAQYGTIGGGRYNSNIFSTAPTIAGGESNLIEVASWSTISGGRANSITNSSGSSTIGGGADNAITNSVATIGGGTQNTASGSSSTIGGGYSNTASGDGATVPGGVENVAAGTASFAAGGYASANHNGAFVWNSSALPFASTGSGQFLINPSGNVGIGTNAPSAKLHLDTPGGGGIHLSSNNLGDLRISFNNGGGTHYIFDDQSDSNSLAIETGLGNDFVINTNGANNRMRITSGGLIGMARTPTTNRLEVEGNASKTTSGGWLANSDACIKEDVRTITDALSIINRLRPVAFRYTDEYKSQHPSVEDQDYYNFIAQEFAEVFPEAVSEDGSGILQMDSHPASIYAVAAIQELDVMVKKKNIEIKKLAETNAALEARLARIEQLLLETSNKGGQ